MKSFQKNILNINNYKKTKQQKNTLTLQPKIEIKKEKCPKQKRPQKDKKDKTGQRKREKWVRPQNLLKRPKCTFPSKNRDYDKECKGIVK